MKDTRCEPVRRELDELMLNEEFSAAVAGHLQSCAGCREFQREQTKLRQIVGSLGTVSAPADFDFRLRARLAADARGAGVRYWSFAVKGLATAAILVVFGVGVAVLWQREKPQSSVAQATAIEQKKTDEVKAVDEHKVIVPAVPEVTLPGPELTPTIAVNHETKRRVERPFVAKTTRSLTSVDFSSERANVVGNARPTLNNEPVFPIEASVQSLKVSLDDGRGNARTISFPSVSFGSQRVLTNANQFNPKGVW
jgi:hypothetical protein